MLLAGYAPSAVGLTATLYMLAKHPSVQTKLRNAIEEIMPTGAPYDAVPSLEEVRTLTASLYFFNFCIFSISLKKVLTKSLR